MSVILFCIKEVTQVANKTFNTRIKNKRDTSANWTSKDPVLLDGELIIVDTASGETRFKIGDGTKKYSQLPFQDEILRNSKVDLDAGVYTATASSTDGIAYSATVPGITALTAGASFIMIPNKASTSKAPTLNVNGLGAKPIRRRLSSLTTSLQQGYSINWIALNKPFTVVYDGTAWVVEGLTKLMVQMCMEQLHKLRQMRTETTLQRHMLRLLCCKVCCQRSQQLH